MLKAHLHTLFFASIGHFLNDGVDFIIPLIGAIFAAVKEVTPFEVTIMFLIYYGSGAVFSS